MSKRKIIRKGFFKLNWGILVLTAIIYGLNVIIILQMVPVFEKSDFISKFLNLLLFPANFLFEDIFGVSSLRIIDVLSWGLEFFYAYFLACVVRRLLKIRVKI